jgi:hypothetical protein
MAPTLVRKMYISVTEKMNNGILFYITFFIFKTGYLTTLSVSTLCNFDVTMIIEYEAVNSMGTGRRKAKHSEKTCSIATSSTTIPT